jgi:maltoporin
MALYAQDFTIEQGSSFILQFQLTDDNNKPLQLAVADPLRPGSFLTNNYFFRARIKKTKYRSGSDYFDIAANTLLQPGKRDNGEATDGFYIISEEQGTAKMVISAASTADIKYGKWYYDIEVVQTKGGGLEVTKVLSGRINVEREVTTD